MLLKSILTGMLLICSLSSGLTQPRLSLGLICGLQVHPSRERYNFPLLGASAWYEMKKNIFMSGEFTHYQGVDVYPARSDDFLVPVRVHDNSNTQRLALGVHRSIKIVNHSSVTLVGINFGHSWDKRGYQLVDSRPESSQLFYGYVEEHLRRPVLYGSLTALSQNKKLPFFLQTRYGYSFNEFFATRKNFLQVIAGINLGVW